MINNSLDMQKALGAKLAPENLLCFGTENGRGLGLTAYTRSSVSFTIPGAFDFERVLRDLRLFSSVLRVRNPSDVFYGWDVVYFSRESRTVAFDILWYDESYFLKRKNAYKSFLHERLFTNFGITPNELKVEHSSIGYINS